MKLSRRALLRSGLGASQLALLGRMGLGSHPAWAGIKGGPTKLLTIYVPGGWFPPYLFCPLSDGEIDSVLPEPTTSMNEPCFFRSADVQNLDGTGDAMDGLFQRLRVAKLWDEASLSAGGSDARDGTSPHGWAWQYHQLWEDTTVVHGVDMGSAAHDSALVSAMCGVAGTDYRAAALQARVADALYDRFRTERPLGCVSLGAAPVPNPLDLRAEAAPIQVTSLGSLEYFLSDRVDAAWAGLRDRPITLTEGFDGSALSDGVAINAMDQRVLARTQALRGSTTDATDGVYSALYGMVSEVSRQLALDVVSILEDTPGVEATPHPHWVNTSWTHFGSDIGGGISSDNGSSYEELFELALKLLKSNLTSVVHLETRGQDNFYFDTHGSGGHTSQWVYLRALWDVIGRFLGELKASPGVAGGSSLLGETLVVIQSEFSRTWPGSETCDHWPTSSTIFCGGGVIGNRMIGGYDLSTSATSTGFYGVPTDVIEEDGSAGSRALRSADVVHTALAALDIEDRFIPGGSGEIVGVTGS